MERWQRVKEIVERARQLADAERSKLLDTECRADVDLRRRAEALLSALDAPEPNRGENRSGRITDLLPGDFVGPYRLERLLGHGGMGAVYLARRADDEFERQVAIKVLKPGLATRELIQRFGGERRILAQLGHPSIAELLDAGNTDDGCPYLILEYVEGMPVDRYCAERHLDIAARLRLFAGICRAVQFAHQNLVVHRDLKPGNILVTEDGEPKLLDFGIAKLLGPWQHDETAMMTVDGRAPMTPAYASPEQLAGSAITTASDVFSLGVLLYRLLAGRRPPAASAAEVDGTLHVERPRPSRAVLDGTTTTEQDELPLADRRRLSRLLQGDLDTIAMTALQPDLNQRYASAEQLGGDVERYLTGQPLMARRRTLLYNATKFVRRHRIAVGATLFAFAALVALSATLLVQREKTQQQRRRAETVSSFMVHLFELPDPARAQGESVTVREALDRGVAEIAGSLHDEPEVRADVLQTMGQTYKNLGLFEEARPLLEEALEIRTRMHGSRHPEVAASLQRLADLVSIAGDQERAEVLNRRALAVRIELFGETHPDVVESTVRLARILQHQNRFDEAARLYEQGELAARKIGDPDLLELALERRASLLRSMDRLDEAGALFEEALELHRRNANERHPERALTLNDLGLVALQRGDSKRAEELFRQAAAIQRRVLGGEHPSLATSLTNLGLAVEAQAEYDEAEAAYGEALQIQRTAYRGEHPNLAATLNNFAVLRRRQGRLDEAESLQREALTMQRRTVGREHRDTAQQLNNLGLVLALRGHLDEAEELYREALEVNRALLGDDHSAVGLTLSNLGDVQSARGDAETAAGLYRRASGILRRQLGSESRDLAFALYKLADCELQLGDFSAAAASAADAVEVGLRTLGTDSEPVAMMRLQLADVLTKTGRCGEAAQPAKEALDSFRSRRGDDDPWVRSAQKIVARCENAGPPPS